VVVDDISRTCRVIEVEVTAIKVEGQLDLAAISPYRTPSGY
jgi:hypothetical protein